MGIALLEAVLERWPTGNVEVATFTTDSPGGQPARALYERFGLVCCGRTHPAPTAGRGTCFYLVGERSACGTLTLLLLWRAGAPCLTPST